MSEAGGCVEVCELTEEVSGAARARAQAVLETGGVLLLPATGFGLEASEHALLDPALGKARVKNISLDPATGRVGGSVADQPTARALEALMARYAAWAERLVLAVAPAWEQGLERARTSLRPRPAGAFTASVRKDDRLLHVDAFPSQPVQGRRILRVFSNIDPAGAERVWTVGQPFEAYAGHFAPRLKPRSRARAMLSHRLGVTRGRRSPYDEAMLQLHDLAKTDAAWQAAAPRRTVAFPAGSSWLVFTDAVPHAVQSGRNALEQTFYLSVGAMEHPERSPLRILERLTGAVLA